MHHAVPGRATLPRMWRVRAGAPYGQLLSAEDEAFLPTLRDFMAITDVRQARAGGAAAAQGGDVAAQEQYRRGMRARLEPLVAAYLPGELVW